MTYTITDECIVCGSCEPFCKNGAILYNDTKYVIDESKCDSCGTCLEYCPIDDAILEKPVREMIH
jgi:MinD superfamily P-loop ATPase